jgi:hypothetical protein
MKKLALLLCALAASSFAQTVTVNGIPNQVLTAIPNASLSNSSITFNGACGESSPGATSLGGTATFTNQTLVNAQSGTTYTVLSSDCGKFVTFSNAASQAVTLPQATGSFASGFIWYAGNLGAGTVTITPTTSTINGLSTLTLTTGQGGMIVADPSGNYQILTGKSSGGSGTVTSDSFTGGLISVANPTTTPAFTVAGTSGGIPYFSSASTWASSAALAANAVILGGGAGAAPTVTATDTTITHALFATAGAPAFRAMAATDLPVVVAPGVNNVTFSATPAFNLSLGNNQTITLTANVTSFTITNGAAGQHFLIDWIQDATGSRTVSGPPAALHGFFTIGSTASKHNAQEYYTADGSNFYALAPGIINQ